MKSNPRYFFSLGATATAGFLGAIRQYSEHTGGHWYYGAIVCVCSLAAYLVASSQTD